jgi:hypothetical protein
LFLHPVASPGPGNREQEIAMDPHYYGLALWVWLFIAPIGAALMSLRAGRPPFNVH